MAAWTFALGWVALAALLGPTIMFIVPIILTVGAAIARTHDLATAPPKCPECGVIRDAAHEPSPALPERLPARAA